MTSLHLLYLDDFLIKFSFAQKKNLFSRNFQIPFSKIVLFLISSELELNHFRIWVFTQIHMYIHAQMLSRNRTHMHANIFFIYIYTHIHIQTLKNGVSSLSKSNSSNLFGRKRSWTRTPRSSAICTFLCCPYAPLLFQELEEESAKVSTWRWKLITFLVTCN